MLLTRCLSARFHFFHCIRVILDFALNTKNRCAPIYTRLCFPRDGPTKTVTALHWIHLSLSVCVFACVHVCTGTWYCEREWGKEKERVRVGLWPQSFRASVFNFRGAAVWLLALRYCTPCPIPPLCLQYFHVRIIQLSKHCCAVPSDSPCELYYKQHLLSRAPTLSLSVISF